MDNIDLKTVTSFGEEWKNFSQDALSGSEFEQIFKSYFSIFPFAKLPALAEGFDMGCGSGRWAKGIAPHVGRLNCIDPAYEALAVARKNLVEFDNVIFHNSPTSQVTLSPESQDFGYSLGVLHHIPDTLSALKDCTKLLKPGAPFLLYLYYRFDNRPAWFRLLWKASEVMRSFVRRLPNGAKNGFTNVFAAIIYWPLARASFVLEKCGLKVANLPLSFYRDKSFYTMRTDSRDRFGTPLEQRFTRQEIGAMMQAASLKDVLFSEQEPYWVACGTKQA